MIPFDYHRATSVADAVAAVADRPDAVFLAGGTNLVDDFVHYSEIRGSGFRSLEENQRVEFAVEQGAKGPQATGVTAV